MTVDTHGSEYAYKLGCRCADCRSAVAKARRLRRKGLGPGIITGLQVHGSSSYSKHGCRCEICTAAHTRDMRLYRQRKAGAW